MAAQKKLEEMGRASGGADAIKARETKAKEPKRGKKEEQKIAAQNVGGKFAPPSRLSWWSIIADAVVNSMR